MSDQSCRKRVEGGAHPQLLCQYIDNVLYFESAKECKYRNDVNSTVKLAYVESLRSRQNSTTYAKSELRKGSPDTVRACIRWKKCDP